MDRRTAFALPLFVLAIGWGAFFVAMWAQRGVPSGLGLLLQGLPPFASTGAVVGVMRGLRPLTVSAGLALVAINVLPSTLAMVLFPAGIYTLALAAYPPKEHARKPSASSAA